MIPLVGSLGTPELLIILAVLVLLFGASKLPELARGTGRALRIFKAETKGLLTDEDDDRPAVERPAAGRTTVEPTVVQDGEPEVRRQPHQDPTD
ncbi:MAG: Sec-independent protein translocase subunit TatA [Marmoricola sp.]